MITLHTCKTCKQYTSDKNKCLECRIAEKERNRIADALEQEAMEMRVKPRDGHGGATALREFAWRLRKGEV